MSEDQVYELLDSSGPEDFGEVSEDEFFCRKDVAIRISVEEALNEHEERKHYESPWTEKFFDGARLSGRAALVMLLALGATACGPHQAVLKKEALANRASFDFECPKDKLQFTPLDPEPHDESYAPLFWHTVGVRGCEKKAVYLYQPGGGEYVWVLNTDGRKDSAPAAQ